jgi:hypothetical protein
MPHPIRQTTIQRIFVSGNSSREVFLFASASFEAPVKTPGAIAFLARNPCLLASEIPVASRLDRFLRRFTKLF